MHICGLKVENFKRVKAVEIRPEGESVTLAGGNGEGKSSVLDAIWAALNGRYASRIEKPIHEGAKEAVSELDLGTLIVTRRWKGGKSTLTVTNKDGASYSSPQTILDSFVGKLTFDPGAFAAAAPKDQVDMLLGVIDLGLDLEKLERDIKGAEEDRRDIGREGRKLKGAFESMSPVPEGTPDKPFSASDLMAELEAAEGAARANERDRAALKGKRDRLAEVQAEIEDLEDRLNDARGRKGSLTDEIRDMAPKVADLVDPDIEPIRERIRKADEINAAVRAKQEITAAAARLEAARGQYAEVDERVKALRESKRVALEGADMPIDGLGFDDGAVTYKGVPFSQASAAERYEVSLAIAMALNPELKFIRVSDAAVFDTKTRDRIFSRAKEAGYQLWVEVVEDPGKAAVLIEDGQIINRVEG